MHNTTKKRIEFLQSQIQKKTPSFYKKYGDNLSSIRVDKKRKGKKVKNYYSIVFNVVKKLKEKEIPKNQIIPKHIPLKFPNGKLIQIKTDVRQTGEFKFHLGPMDSVRDAQSNNPGTLALILKDNRENYFGLTNYHVAAEQLLQNGKFSYDVTRGDPRHDVFVGGNSCRLHVGAFEPNLDAAFVFLGSNLVVSNALPDGIRINTSTFIEGPISVSERGKIASLYLPSRAGRFNTPILENNIPLNHRLVRFTNLIAVRKCSRGGDSGSLVLLDRNILLGIIIGGDEVYSYIVPYFKIHSFFPLQII